MKEQFEIITSPISGWKKQGTGFVTGEGLYVDSNFVKDLCENVGVPTSLVTLDARYPDANVTLDILKSALKEQPKLVVSEQEVASILDPRSKWFSDAEFDDFVSSLTSKGLAEPQVISHGAEKQVLFDLPQQDTDLVVNDVFKKRVRISRLAQGGVFTDVALLRVICTNGCTTADKNFKELFRRDIRSERLSTRVDVIRNMNISEYFSKLFSKDGEYFEASVANFMGMRKTLQTYTNQEVASKYFPIEPIKTHYEKQNIDIESLPMNLLEKIPSGLTYYDCFNILTHGAKQIENMDLTKEIAISAWSRPSKLNQLKSTSSLQFKGKPTFDYKEVERLKGDAA